VPPGLDRPYPNLATVPDKQPSTGTTRERLVIEEGLLADRQNARHVQGPVAGEERTALLPPGAGVPTTVIDPRQVRTAANPQPAAAPARGAARGPVGSIAFTSGAATLPEGSGRLIVRAAEIHRRYGGTLVVVAHAARAEGDPATRQALAMRRATTIANGLMNLGVQQNQIRVGTSDGKVDAARVDIALAPAR
jgi:outer membrane protein OmpA-like peptidoglycan-associated protein